jgi:hypothetical protein
MERYHEVHSTSFLIQDTEDFPFNLTWQMCDTLNIYADKQNIMSHDSKPTFPMWVRMFSMKKTRSGAITLIFQITICKSPKNEIRWKFVQHVAKIQKLAGQEAWRGEGVLEG